MPARDQYFLFSCLWVDSHPSSVPCLGNTNRCLLAARFQCYGAESSDSGSSTRDPILGLRVSRISPGLIDGTFHDPEPRRSPVTRGRMEIIPSVINLPIDGQGSNKSSTCGVIYQVYSHPDAPSLPEDGRSRFDGPTTYNSCST